MLKIDFFVPIDDVIKLNLLLYKIRNEQIGMKERSCVLFCFICFFFFFVVFFVVVFFLSCFLFPHTTYVFDICLNRLNKTNLNIQKNVSLKY